MADQPQMKRPEIAQKTDSAMRYPSLDSARSAAGRLVTFGLDGTRYTPALGAWFRKYQPAGIALFKHNIINARQTAGLIADIKKLGEDISGAAPFIAVDQEGGRVSRFPKDYMSLLTPLKNNVPGWDVWPERFPTARSLGAEGSAEHVEQAHSLMGKALRALGFTVDFAPVLDLDTNPASPVIGDRSFGADPARVAALGKAALKGLRSENILTCAKHFPGHGHTSQDSHHHLPVDARPAGRFHDAELAPFRTAVEEKVDFIMTAHVLYPAFDKNLPATLSQKIITGLLREEMGYQGAVITDDMDMKAITSRWNCREAVELALQAGCDNIMVCRDPGRQEETFATIRSMIDSSALPEDEVKARMQRVFDR